MFIIITLRKVNVFPRGKNLMNQLRFMHNYDKKTY